MDLQEFNSEMLYFQESIDPEVERLVNEAASNYGPSSEGFLLQALEIAPGDLTALIGLYRFYYYQNRFTDGLNVAHKVMNVVGQKIEFPTDWRDITMAHVLAGLRFSFCLVRLYLFALKAAGYLQLRMAKFEDGREMIEKVVAMDSANRIGAQLLLDVLDKHKAPVVSFPQKLKREAC